MFSLHASPWMAAYFVAGLVGALLTTLVNARGRGPLRAQLALLLGGVTAILFTTGSVFAAADESTATLAVRFSQAAVVWLPFFGVRFASALARRPLAVLTRLTLVSAPIASALALAPPLVIARTRPYPYRYARVPRPLY